jgi:hypothetical protein
MEYLDIWCLWSCRLFIAEGARALPGLLVEGERGRQFYLLRREERQPETLKISAFSHENVAVRNQNQKSTPPPPILGTLRLVDFSASSSKEFGNKYKQRFLMIVLASQAGPKEQKAHKKYLSCINSIL